MIMPEAVAETKDDTWLQMRQGFAPKSPDGVGNSTAANQIMTANCPDGGQE